MTCRRCGGELPYAPVSDKPDPGYQARQHTAEERLRRTSSGHRRLSPARRHVEERDLGTRVPREGPAVDRPNRSGDAIRVMHAEGS